MCVDVECFSAWPVWHEVSAMSVAMDLRSFVSHLRWTFNGRHLTVLVVEGVFALNVCNRQLVPPFYWVHWVISLGTFATLVVIPMMGSDLG